MENLVYIDNMKHSKRTDGYIAVQYEGKQVLLHRLLAELFIPNPHNKPCVNHINGIKNDNRIENLEWVTWSENRLHAIHKLGVKVTNNTKKGEDTYNAKLSKFDVDNIRNSSLTGKELAKKYNVSTSLISGIKNNKRWK